MALARVGFGWKSAVDHRNAHRHEKSPERAGGVKNEITGCGPVGRALDLGSRSRAFESPHSDQVPLRSTIPEGDFALQLYIIVGHTSTELSITSWNRSVSTAVCTLFLIVLAFSPVA